MSPDSTKVKVFMDILPTKTKRELHSFFDIVKLPE